MQDDRFVAAIQAAVVATINTLGVALIGSEFTTITSSPIPDCEVARIIATTGIEPSGEWSATATVDSDGAIVWRDDPA